MLRKRSSINASLQIRNIFINKARIYDSHHIWSLKPNRVICQYQKLGVRQLQERLQGLGQKIRQKEEQQPGEPQEQEEKRSLEPQRGLPSSEAQSEREKINKN